MDRIQFLRCIGAYGYSASRKVPKDPKFNLRFFLSHFIWLPQEALGEVGEGAEGPLSWVHRVAVGHLNLIVKVKILQSKKQKNKKENWESNYRGPLYFAEGAVQYITN